MVICECGRELTLKQLNGDILRVSCSKCGLDYKRSFWDKKLLVIKTPFGHTGLKISMMISDLWRVFKRKEVNFAVEFTPKSGYWFEWWTPTWHFSKGPYITIALWRIRIYRGY